MKIIIIAPYAMYQDYTSSFIHNQMKAVVNSGNEVMVLAPIAILKKDIYGNRFGKPVMTVIKDGVTIKYIRYFSLSSLGKRHFNVISAITSMVFWELRSIKGYNPDLIWAHAFNFSDKIGCFLKQKLKKPLVLTTHGGDTESFVQNYDKKKSVLKGIDWIVCVSKKLERKLLDLGIHNVSCIENGFCIERVKERKKDVNKIIQVGHLIESKHFEITIMALQELVSKGYKMHLDIVGEGPQKVELMKLVQDNGLESYVVFHGQKTNEEVLEMMAGAKYFVMPSFPEGLGIVYLEAMGSRCITIGTKNEGIDGIIKNNLNGFLVDRNDYKQIAKIIEECIKNKELSSTISEKAYNTVKDYSWEKNASNNIEILGKVVIKGKCN